MESFNVIRAVRPKLSCSRYQRIVQWEFRCKHYSAYP
jgi:hypothetical protein